MIDTTLTKAMDNVDEAKPSTAEPADAEKKSNAATVFGKFGSVDALIAAYSSLEAEFTRRSQRLKELEQGNKAQDMPDKGALSPKPQDLISAALENESVKTAVIEQYLKELSGGKSIPLVCDGASPATPRSAPKTVREAGALVKNFLK